MPIQHHGEENSIYRIQVLDRAFQILSKIAEEETGVSLPEVAQGLQLHKSTAHRLLMALEAARFIEKNPVGGRYRLGSRVMELGLSAGLAARRLSDRRPSSSLAGGTDRRDRTPGGSA
jgi:DNA-binding IclR family transcriptional regulator